MPDQQPASMTSFYAAMGDGFVDQHSENCCCGQCVTGWNYLQMMVDFVNDMSNVIKDYKAKAHKVGEIKKSLDYDYRWEHLTDSSCIETHCMSHALSSGDACHSN